MRFIQNLSLLLVLCVCGAPPPALAQSNPPVAACGLPVGGYLSQPVTQAYSLTGDCTQTSQLYLSSNVGGTVTINGNGYEIDGSALSGTNSVIKLESGTKLDIDDVTFNGGGSHSNGILELQDDLALDSVSFKNHYGPAISSDSGKDLTATLDSVLIEQGTGFYFGSNRYPNAIAAAKDAVFNITDLVVRDLAGGNSAIGLLSGNTSSNSVNITGCFTAERIFPQLFIGNVNDQNTGKCSGTIGNGDNAVKTVAAPAPAACGLPPGGYLGEDAKTYTFKLSGDCVQTGTLYVPVGVQLTILGEQHSISANQGVTGIFTAGKTTIDKAVFTGFTEAPIHGLLDGPLMVANSIFRGNRAPTRLNDHKATFSNALFENNNAIGTLYSYSALRISYQNQTTLRRTIFRNNQASLGAVTAFYNSLGAQPRITLETCISWINNSTPDYAGSPSYLVDRTGGRTCPEFTFFPPEPEAAASSATPPSDGLMVGGGDLSKFFRFHDGDQARIQIYEIDRETSEGTLSLTATQAQVDARTKPGVVATAADCRAQIMVDEKRNVTLKTGPDDLGRYQHTVIEGSLSGYVISLYTTLDDPICPFGLPPARTLSNCVVRANFMLNFRARPAGPVIALLPYNATLTAFARTDGWFHVDYRGERGWISAEHVKPMGDCG